MEKVLNVEDDPFSSLDDIKEDYVQTIAADLVFLQEKFPDQVDHNITLDEYIDFVIEVNTTHEKLTKKDIFTEVIEVLEMENENESVD